MANVVTHRPGAGRVAGVLLAAGAGRRFGRPKALVALGTGTLVGTGVRTLLAGGCAPVVVVLGARADEVLAAEPARTGLEAAGRAGRAPGIVRAVVAADWSVGLSASLRAGLAACEDQPEVTAVVVALADQPLIGPGAVVRLIAARRPEARAAVATYGGVPRNPVLLERSVWSEVAAAAHDDAGARVWLRAHPELVTAVDCDGTGRPDDIDTPADLARVVRLRADRP